MKKKRALISVFNKNDIVRVAQFLQDNAYEIYSSGGTANHLYKEGIDVHYIENLTKFPEILNGRLKTLHPSIHGGLLADTENEAHVADLDKNNILPFHVAIVNLYPFVEKINLGLDDKEMVEWIDIGGPTMLRAAAKNYKNIFGVCDPSDYGQLIENIHKPLEETLDFRKHLAGKIFKHVSNYDMNIAQYLHAAEDIKTLKFEKGEPLRYGENPHQNARFHPSMDHEGIWNDHELIQGKALSFNNIRDTDITWKIASEFDQETVCVATKHSTPCGVALAESGLKAYEKVIAADNQSIFGGVVAFNSTVTEEMAVKMSEIFLEIIMAFDFSDEALKIFEKKKNLRLIRFKKKYAESENCIQVSGGLLCQEPNKSLYAKLEMVTEAQPTEEDMLQGIFGIKVIKHTKSNAIIMVEDFVTTGISGGQVNRYIAAQNAVQRAAGKNRILISDGFFPFSDIVNFVGDQNVKVIFQPGGSIRDKNSIECCNKYGIAMVFTHMRHFSH